MPNTSHWVELHGQFSPTSPNHPKNMVFLARIGFSAPRDTMVVLLSRNTYKVVISYFTLYTPMQSSVDVEYRPSNHPKMTFWSFFFLLFFVFFHFFALFRDHYLTEEKEFLQVLHTEIFINVLRNKRQWQDRHRLCASWRNGFMSKTPCLWGVVWGCGWKLVMKLDPVWSVGHDTDCMNIMIPCDLHHTISLWTLQALRPNYAQKKPVILHSLL